MALRTLATVRFLSLALRFSQDMLLPAPSLILAQGRLKIESFEIEIFDYTSATRQNFRNWRKPVNGIAGCGKRMA